MAWRLPLYIFIMGQSRFSLKITAIAAKRRPGRGARVRDWGGGRRTSATPPSMPLGLESRRGLLWLRAQCGLGERVEQLDCSAGDAEDLTTATSQCNPRFERRDTLSAEALNPRCPGTPSCDPGGNRHGDQLLRPVRQRRCDLALHRGGTTARRPVSRHGWLAPCFI